MKNKIYTKPITIWLSDWEMDMVTKIAERKHIAKGRLIREYMDRAIKDETP